MEEIWKSIPGYEGYEVSNLGRVMSTRSPGRRRVGECMKISKPRLLSLYPGSEGYTCVSLQAESGKAKTFKVHYLVMLAFVGERPPGLDVCHNDDDKNNNTLSNLRYDSRIANILDIIQNRDMHYGCKFTYEQLVRAINMSNQGFSIKDIADNLGVTEKRVTRIMKTSTYKLTKKKGESRDY